MNFFRTLLPIAESGVSLMSVISRPENQDQLIFATATHSNKFPVYINAILNEVKARRYLFMSQ